MQLSGSVSQFVLHSNRSQSRKPIGGVNATPLSSAHVSDVISASRRTASRNKMVAAILKLKMCKADNEGIYNRKFSVWHYIESILTRNFDNGNVIENGKKTFYRFHLIHDLIPIRGQVTTGHLAPPPSAFLRAGVGATIGYRSGGLCFILSQNFLY